MMTLLDRIGAIASDRTALIVQDAEFNFADICARARVLAPRVRDVRLALFTRHVEGAIPLMLAADGNARALGIISPIPDAPAADLLKLFGPDIMFTDADTGPPGEEGPERGLSGKSQKAAAADREPGVVAGRTSWVLTTSGTTSSPKLVSHDLESLTRTTRCDTARGATQTWGLLYDYTRFAGMQVLLQSLLSGACLAVPPPGATLSAQLEFLERAGCNHLSATPTMWRRILMTPGAERLPLRQVTLGGEIADDAVLGLLARAYPAARVSHVFASTEAGVGFSVTDGRAGFPARFLEQPPYGIGLKIQDGRLWVFNEKVESRYLGGDTAFAQAGWVDTGDSVEHVGDRVLFRGRENGVINVGGNKVHPEEVECVLLAHPQVAMARVYGRPNPISGSVVVAEVVPTGDTSGELEIELARYLRGRLGKHMIPASIRRVATLGYGAAGKIERGVSG